MHTTNIVLLVLLALFALSQGLGLDCDNSNHACDTCVNANCYWCESGSEASFCTSNPNLCLRGTLHEDSLWCPVVRSIESLDWWGENAFFSRVVSCQTFSNGKCEDCIWNLDEPQRCGWCPDMKKCSPVNAGAGCPQETGCSVARATPVSATEDISVVWNINPLFAVHGESNTTQNSTSIGYTVSANAQSGSCNVTFDSGSDNITVNPKANWFGLCTIRVVAAARSLVFGHNTTLSNTVSFNFASVNDAPLKNESSWDAAVAPLASFNQTGSVTLEGCRMFYDDDSENFGVTITFSTTSGNSPPTYTPGSCFCYNATNSCPIKLVATDIWEGKLTFTAKDPQAATVQVVQDVTITAVNRPPTASPGNVTMTALESDNDPVTRSFANDFSDPDAGTTLTYTLVDGFGNLGKGTFDRETLSVSINQSTNGVATSRVSASDGTYTATKWVTLTVTAVNDEVVIASSMNNKLFSAPSATNETFDLSPFITDEESNFAAGTLKCTPGTISGGEAIVTITKNIMLIQHRQESSGVSCLITCDDSNSPTPSIQTFTINIQNTLTNLPPVVKAAFPNITAVPPTSGQITVGAFNFSDYFSDPNIYQTINYNVVPSNSSYVGFSSTTGGFTVFMAAGASGSYTLNVTATDEKGASISQLVRVLAYVKVVCLSSLSLNWNATSPLEIDLASMCTSSNSFTVTFTEQTSGPYDLVTPTVTGTKITLVANTSCLSGVYQGYATVTDSLNGSSLVGITVTINNTQASVTPKKSQFSYLVAQGPVNSTYDGALNVTVVPGGHEIALKLDDLVSLCASTGPIEYTYNRVSFVPLQGSSNGFGSLVEDIEMVGADTYFLFTTDSTDSLMTVKLWQYVATISARDTSRINPPWMNFTLTVTKDTMW